MQFENKIKKKQKTKKQENLKAVVKLKLFSN